MFVTFLRFSDNRAAAPEFMAAHNDWLAQGFADGAFLCAGSLAPAGGGALLPHSEDRAALEARIATDPFVRHGIVAAEIHEIDVRHTVPALDLLRAPA